jgi:hypothetical protein
MAVAVREGLYMLLSLVCLCVHPAFLLVDVRATVAQRTGACCMGMLTEIDLRF